MARTPNARAYNVRTAIIVAADEHIKNILSRGVPATLFDKMLREVDNFLLARMQGEVEVTETELAVGWLIKERRIGLDLAGANPWVHYQGVEPLAFEESSIRLSFADVQTYTHLRNAELAVAFAEARRDDSLLSLLEAREERFKVYDMVRNMASASNTAEAVPV